MLSGEPNLGDVAKVLRATACASEGSCTLALDLLLSNSELRARLDAAGIPCEQLLQVYRQGFHDALVSVGLAFGLEPVGLNTRAPGAGVRQAAEASQAPTGLLWAEMPHDRR